MVCDLQGVFDPAAHAFKLTDPCLLSEVGRELSGFGRTDRSVVGMADFFTTHRCNALCRALGLDDSTKHEQEVIVKETLRLKKIRDAKQSEEERAKRAERDEKRAKEREKAARRQKKKQEARAKKDDFGDALREAQETDKALEAPGLLGRVAGAVKSAVLGRGDAEDETKEEDPHAPAREAKARLKEEARQAGYAPNKKGVEKYLKKQMQIREDKARREAAKAAAAAEEERLAAEAARAPKRAEDVARALDEQLAAESRAAEAADPRVAPLPHDSDDEFD